MNMNEGWGLSHWARTMLRRCGLMEITAWRNQVSREQMTGDHNKMDREAMEVANSGRQGDHPRAS